MIKVKHLSKSYPGLWALDDVSLTVQKGTITGIVGPNGAGKTTLFKILTGLIRASSGDFEIDSTKKKKIGAIIENPHLYEYMSAYDNLRVFMAYQGIHAQKSEIQEKLIEVGLDPLRNDPIQQFSLGMKQRLGIATALLNEPDALILDEPFLGLDPVGMRDLRDMMMNLARLKGLAILVSSHQLEELSKSCEYIYLLHQGKITAYGKTTEILHRATHTFKVVCRDQLPHDLLKGYEVVQQGDLYYFTIDRVEAKSLMEKILAAGFMIDEFSPVINLENLYAQG